MLGREWLAILAAIATFAETISFFSLFQVVNIYLRMKMDIEISLQHFTKDLLLEIFTFLDPLTLCRAALTSKMFNEISKGKLVMLKMIH